ncbi:hypothetical protein [Actinoplanes sp. NPDC049599]|uniref:VMAP-C domain-containing protein n=1 Tax=Actinoplanes sp. NPDC049599 TaxID=3363903 RepID=UPI0037A5F248
MCSHQRVTTREFNAVGDGWRSRSLDCGYCRAVRLVGWRTGEREAEGGREALTDRRIAGGAPPFQAQKKLCDLLVQLSGMTEPGRREMYVRQLSKEVPAVLHAERHPDPFSDVFELVERCYAYPGAIRQLWVIVKSFHSDSQLTSEIEEIVELLDPGRPLLIGERDRLEEMLQEVDLAVLRTAYRYAARVTADGGWAEPPGLPSMIRRIESIAASPDRLPSMFTFVDHVGHRVPAGLSADLHSWMDDVSHRLGYRNGDEVDSLCSRTRLRLHSIRTFYFAAQLVADKMSAERFFLSIWAQHGDEPEQPMYSADDSAPLDDVVKQLYFHLRALPSSLDEQVEELVIEVYLPRSLVTLPVDQWRIDEVLPHEIGTSRPLVLRSLDRLEDLNLHGQWAVKWQWLMDHGRLAGATAFRTISGHSEPEAQALRGALLAGEPPVAVIMKTPVPYSNGLAADGFTAALYGGAPVVVWSREPCHAAAIEDAVLTAADSDGGAPRIVDHIFKMRLAALQDVSVDHPGRHASLLFDDADRIPEAYRPRSRLRVPLSRGGNGS